MPYYSAGDYYQGDYYQGDIFGSIARGITGAARGFLRGGPVGAVTGAVTSIARTREMPPPPPPMIAPRSMALVAGGGFGPGGSVPRTTPGAVPQPGLGGTIARVLPGGSSGYVSAASLGQGAPSGYHWNKSFSYAKGLPAGSFLVRNRHMNPLNPRALRRTVRRQRGAVGLMRAVLSGSGYTIKRSGLPGKGRKRARR